MGAAGGFAAGDIFPVGSHEAALDRSILIDQEMSGEIIRCIICPAPSGAMQSASVWPDAAALTRRFFWRAAFASAHVRMKAGCPTPAGRRRR